MPINPDAFDLPTSGNGRSPMTRWLGELRSLQSELRQVTSRFSSGKIEAGGTITVAQRQRLHDRFDTLVIRMKNLLENVP